MAESKLDKIVGSIAGKTVEVYVTSWLREHARSLVLGSVATIFGVGGVTSWSVWAISRTWASENPIAVGFIASGAIFVIGLLLLWRGLRSISRAMPTAVVAMPSAQTSFDWSNPTAVLTAQLEHPVFEGATGTLWTNVVLLSFRELPPGTRVIRWSAGLTMNGTAVGKPEKDGADKELVRSGKTDLGRVGVRGFPIAPFVAADVAWRNIDVRAEFSAEIRQPGRIDPIILNVETVPQVLKVN